jgi:tetratricopeptide (TPR) repeat protein
VNFIWDDEALILENPFIKSFSNFFKIFLSHLTVYSDRFYRPIQSISNMLDFSLYKFNYRGYHFTNILLHIFAAILAYKFLLIITRRKNLSFPAVLLFLVCPLWVESVTYISGRADLLMAIFILLSFIFFIREKMIFSFFFYLLALLSKEASLSYPLLLVLYSLLFKKKDKKDILYNIVSFFIITLIYGFLRLVMMKNVDISFLGYPFYERVAIVIQVIGKYLAMMFLPLNQHVSYAIKIPPDFLSANFLSSLSVFIFLVILFIYYLKKDKIISFFIGWFFIVLLPQSGIVTINAFFAEHFVYLASLGIFVIFIYFLGKIKSKVAFSYIFFGYLVFFSFATTRYNFIWQDPIKFFERVIKFSPQSFSAYNNLGVIYLNRRDFRRAEPMIKKALEIRPQFSEARLNLARFYYLREDYPKAIELAKQVCKEQPQNFLALNYLGTFYFKNKQITLAEEYYKKAIEINPYHVYLWSDLYLFYKTLNRGKEAEDILVKIEKLDRYCLADVYFTEAQTLFSDLKLEEAFSLVNKALKINPSKGEFYNLKGCILKKIGDYPEALVNFKRALILLPGHWDIYNNLGNLFALVQNFPYAEENFKCALRLNEDSPEVNFNLGLSYFEQKKFLEARKYFQKSIYLTGSYPLAKEYLRKIEAHLR